ncbi:hypothetical protein L5515_017237 [Caenorhabditis briggsae]|uniref:Uncharacterized protein n=1 Tax=Caenorhabditis briggsae TaxID=6238 RepID=A0AAE9FGH8_CAEBR|nr:hypothetical protein L5515_017237 [Caenorhabditis briggsae]
MPIDVMRWAALLLQHDQPCTLNSQYRFVRCEGGPGKIHYREFTADGNGIVRIEALPLPEGAGPIYQNTLDSLTRNLNTICNILHGHRPG